MTEHSTIHAVELENFQRCSSKITQMVHRDTEEFKRELSVLLDEINSLEYSLRFVKEQDAASLLLKCCHLVPSPKHPLTAKVYQLVFNLICKQQLVLTHNLEPVTRYLVTAVCQSHAPHLALALRALGAVLYENVGRLTKYHSELLDQGGPLVPLTTASDDDVRRGALQCMENLCMRAPDGSYLSEDHIQVCFQVFVKTLQGTREPIKDELAHCRILVSVLRGLQNILLATKSCQKLPLGPLLAALKAYSVHGLPGHSTGAIPGILHPAPSYQSGTKATSSAPAGRSSSSTTADQTGGQDEPVSLRPSTGKAKKGRKKRSVGKQSDSSTSTASDQTEGAAATDEQVFLADGLGASLGQGYYSSLPLWARVSSSESEFSDTEGGQVAKLRSFTAKVRQCALACLHSVIKSSDKKVMFGYWPSFIPDTPAMGSNSHNQTLFLVIMKDPSPKVRTAALAVLSALLDGSKQYLAAAEDMVPRPTSFTPFSITLGSMIREIHRCLLLALVAENSPLAVTQIIKCLASLVANVPYQRLKPGLLSRLAKQIKPFLSHRDPNIRVACLTCLGSLVSVQAPLLEVCHILHPSRQRGTSVSEAATLDSPRDASEATSPREPPNDNLPSGNSEITASTDFKLVVNEPLRDGDSGYHSSHSQMSAGSDQQGGTDSMGTSPGMVSPAISSGTQTPVLSEQMLHASVTEMCWLIRLCVKNVAPQVFEDSSSQTSSASTPSEGSTHHTKVPLGVTDKGQPLPVRLESLQVLAHLARGYFPVIRPCLSVITDVMYICLQDSDPSIQLHGAKLLEDLGAILLNHVSAGNVTSTPNTALTPTQVSELWIKLLEGPVPSALQNLTQHAVRATMCDCVSNVGPLIFDKLPPAKRILVITLLLGLCSDQDYHVRAAAVRALGVYVLYPCLREDVSFVADAANAILTGLEENNLAVKIKAAWAMGNLSDALVANKDNGDTAFLDDFSDMLLLKLFAVATKAAQDNDKVKSNAVRALGNLLRYLPERSFSKSSFSMAMEQAVQALIKNISSGTMKVRWNACYATGNMFKNQLLPLGQASWTDDIHSALATVVRTCKNFKVRINAALALSVPQKRASYRGTDQFVIIWESLVAGLQAAETVSDFSEYKYMDNLTDQVCCTLVHLVGLVTTDDLLPIYGVLRGREDMLDTYLNKYRHSVLEQEKDQVPEKVSELTCTSTYVSNLGQGQLMEEQRAALDTLVRLFAHRAPGRQHPAQRDSPPKTAFVQSYD